MSEVTETFKGTVNDSLSPTSVQMDISGQGVSPTVPVGTTAAARMDISRIVVSTHPTLAQRFTAAFPGIAHVLNNWFTVPEGDTRSAAQLEREKYTCFCKRSGTFKRWMIVIPSFLIQICIGSLYCWSIFNAPMDAKWGSVGVNAQAFTIAIASEGFVTLIAGNYIERIGPFRCVLYATIFCPLAWAFACLGSYLEERAIVFVLYGVSLGIAGAFGLVGCVANMQRWFPDYRGLAVGYTLMGFGVGATILQLVGNELMKAGGNYELQPFQVQGIFAAFFAIVMTCCLPFFRAPPPDFIPPPAPDRKSLGPAMRVLTWVFPNSKPTPPDKPYTYLEAVIQLEFVLIAIAMFGAFLPGAVFISSAADMTKYVFGKSPSDANTIAALLNVANFTGRIIWGVVAERVGRKTFFIVANIAQGIALGLMALWIHERIFGLWLLSFFVVGSVYGGAHGVLPAFLGQMFGTKISGALHGMLIFVWALSVVVGVPIFSAVVASDYVEVNGKKVGQPGAYMTNAYWLAAMPLLASFVLIFLDTSVRDRVLRKAFKECRVRCFNRVCVIKCLDDRAQARELRAYQDAIKVHKRVRAGTKTVFDTTPDLELQAIPGITGIFDVHGRSMRAIRAASFNALEEIPEIELEHDVAKITASLESGDGSSGAQNPPIAAVNFDAEAAPVAANKV